MSSVAIVIVAFNRPNSLKRLLSSIEKAKYNTKNIPLIISIDFQESLRHKEVVDVAENFLWEFGQKKIIKYDKNIGLRNHVLSCGDLAIEYGNVIVLEDDLYVSPFFYSYTKEALQYYDDSENIGGISLYNHRRNFMNQIPFNPIQDDNDVFFLQIASSWGQAWSKNHWIKFRSWYDNVSLDALGVLPLKVKKWPETSWLKYYIAFLIVNNKFFVYPKKSLTTNFGDGGTHNLEKNLEYQVSLCYEDGFKFKKIDKSLNVYDAYFEILPSKLKLMSPFLEKYDFTVDLYGTKDLSNIETEYLLSSKHANMSRIVFKYGLELKPMCLNISKNIEGDVIKLGKYNDFYPDNQFDMGYFGVFNYFYSKIAITTLIKLIINRLKYKILK